MEMKKITLSDKEFDVPEIAIGKRKYIVPALRKFFKDGGGNILLDEGSYDIALEIIFRAIFPQVKKDDILNMVIDEKMILSSLTVIAEQCGMKKADNKLGEAPGPAI